MKFKLPWLILLVAVGLFVWLKNTTEPPTSLQVINRAPLVAVQVVAKTTAVPKFRMFGQVGTPNKVVLTAGVAADISKVKVLEGDKVRRGQQMIVLDDIDLALILQQRQAELREIEALIENEKIALQADKTALKSEQSLLALAQKAVSRASQLANSKLASAESVDQAKQQEHRQLLAVNQRHRVINQFVAQQQQLKARRNNAKVAVTRAKRDRQRTLVVAPFSGRVTAVLVAVGERVNLGAQLIRLYDDSRLELRAQVPSNYIALLRQAIANKQPILARALNSIKPIDLMLHRLSANVASGQGGIDAFFRVRHGQLPVLGETMEIEMALPPIKNAVVVTAEALYGRNRVYEIRDTVLASKSVRRLGQFHNTEGQHMLILAGDDFTGGEQILNSRLPQAVSGLQVQVMP